MSLENGFQNTILDILQKMIDEKRNDINQTQSGGSREEVLTDDRGKIEIENASITVDNIEQPVMIDDYKPPHDKPIEKKDFVSCKGTIVLQFNNVKVPVKFTLTKDVNLLNEQHKKDILGEN